jgi:TPR repeat protein
MKISSLSALLLAFYAAAPACAATPPAVPDAQMIPDLKALSEPEDSPAKIKEAAELGDAQAASNLAYMYEYGKGMPKNQNEAIKWYTRAAEGGIAEAQNNLGYIYANGKGIPKNLPQAVILYSKAAEQGLAEAQYNLGVMYTNELATQVDYVKAYMWANIAASQNNQNAARMRDMLEKNLPAEQIVEAQRLSKEWMEKHAKAKAAEEKAYGQPAGTSYVEKPAEKTEAKKVEASAQPTDPKNPRPLEINGNKTGANQQANTDQNRPSPYDQIR